MKEKYLNKLPIYIIIFLLVCIFSGCRTSRVENSTTIDSSLIFKEEIKNIYKLYQNKEKERIIYKDSLIKVKALLESSKSFGLDSSYLETSYAKSFACITKEGKLFHNISNKDSIPSKIKYIIKEKKSESNDSNFVNNKITDKEKQKNKIIEKITITKKVLDIKLAAIICLFSLVIGGLLVWKIKK